MVMNALTFSNSFMCQTTLDDDGFLMSIYGSIEKRVSEVCEFVSFVRLGSIQRQECFRFFYLGTTISSSPSYLLGVFGECAIAGFFY